MPYDIPPAFYVVKSINRHLKEQDFSNLSNVEKIDSSRGRTFNSLENALTEVQGNAVVVIAPPGNGKTVSLRNLTIKKVKQRLAKKIKEVPIFINLGYYTGFNPDGTIKDFDIFLEEFFSNSGYYKYLSYRRWETLLQQGRCMFFLDGIDELPRKPGEYEVRSRKITDFVNAWPNIQFILSCRELDYNRELSFQQVLIKPFDRKHIQSYMRKYFPKANYKSFFRQIEESPGIYELCRNPFYLNLICYFSKFAKKIPENKAQLFNFIIDQFIERENKKQNISSIPSFRDDFIAAMSHLAYYLAVEKMITTIEIEKYAGIIRKNNYYDRFMQMIDYAIKGELLEYNEQSREIRFIHNRFQEFFSSYYILSHYRQDKSVLPKNIFTNLWWKETALFVAGLDKNIDDFILLILRQRDNLQTTPKIIERLIKLDMTALAFECIFCNLNFNNDAIYGQIRDNLLEEYDRGDILVKTKVLTAFRHDKSPKVLELIKKATADQSLWVSERAFFMLTDGQLKIQMTPSGIMKEFFRFFIEGRLFNTFVPVLKSSGKSRLIRIFLPVYFILIVASLLSILLVGYVFYSFFEFILFKLKWAFSVECLNCLSTITFSVFSIVYCLTNNNYPFFKRFICVVPLSLIIRFLVFNMPGVFLYRLLMAAIGLSFYLLYITFIKKPNESNWSAASITAFVFGYSIFVPVFNFRTISQIFDLKPAFTVIRNANRSIISRIPEAIQPLLALGFLIISVIVLFIYIYRQIRILNLINRYIQKIGPILAGHSDERKKTEQFSIMLTTLSLIWAQKLLLKNILEKMTAHSSSREQKISFLDSLAQTVKSIQLRDAIYQYLEDEENNFRRLIPDKAGISNLTGE